ncbi:MAG TPA: carboxypeptidase-like regulatory domain-containing protein [Gemmatimonadales bacterium]|nr:carboxypeptidase-like regulatory domain-containing protein [Gemmatimonadales bacterium]
MSAARPPDPIDPIAPLPPPRRSWSAWLGSLALHLGIILLVLLLRRQPDGRDVPGEPVPARATQPQVQMVYVPPPPPERMPAPQPPAPPPPETPRTPPAPPHDEPAPMSPAARPAPPAPASPAPPAAPTPVTPQPAPTTPAPAATTGPQGTLESEAKRLFGGRRANPNQPGPVAIAGLPVYIPDEGNRCTPRPREPDAPVELGTVHGRVYSTSGVPLPGAHLQILGTPYVTFADETGAYSLTFDRHLVDDCRSQVVRVTAPGFRAQNLVLSLGPAGVNDVEMARQ